MADVFRDRKASRSDILEFSRGGGPKASQNLRVSSPPADTTVCPSGLCTTECTKKKLVTNGFRRIQPSTKVLVYARYRTKEPGKGLLLWLHEILTVLLYSWKGISINIACCYAHSNCIHAHSVFPYDACSTPIHKSAHFDINL